MKIGGHDNDKSFALMIVPAAQPAFVNKVQWCKDEDVLRHTYGSNVRGPNIMNVVEVVCKITLQGYPTQCGETQEPET